MRRLSGGVPAAPDLAELEAPAIARWTPSGKEGLTQVRTEHVPLAKVLGRSLRDLAMLRSRLEEQAFYAAGVPWFVALFGRDALLVAMETLAYDPEIAGQTLRLLARHQGEVDDPSRDEEPGKILHEYRVGELAHVGAIPHTPYYGTVDATPLFLVLVAQHASWTGRLDLFHHEPRGKRGQGALAWIAEYGQSTTTGFVEYRSRATDGLANQGWKDSGDAPSSPASGELCRQPIALVEVQGYLYLAKTSIAALFARAREPERAAELRREAAELEALSASSAISGSESEGFFACWALTPEGPAAVLSSNAGQALWTGIVVSGTGAANPWRACSPTRCSPAGESGPCRRISRPALQPCRLSPRHGVAARQCHHRRRLPGGMASTTRRGRIFEGLVDASTHFAMHRLPELFAGFRRSEYGVPVRYPVAVSPAGLGGGERALPAPAGCSPPHAGWRFDQRLRVVRPILPRSVDAVSLHGLRVGRAPPSGPRVRAQNRRSRPRSGCVRTEGSLEVKVEPDGAPRRSNPGLSGKL